VKRISEFGDLKNIFLEAVKRVDPYRMIIDHVMIIDNNLTIEIENKRKVFDLSRFKKIVVLGAGKASAKMAKAVEDIFNDRISNGVVSVKYGHTEKLKHIRLIESGHPIPDENSIRAAHDIASIAENSDENTLIINLISGGGSALISYPMTYRGENENIDLTLDDKQLTTKILLECGATIDEVNSIRKHISSIKGGNLARKLYPATSINFILSDVVGDRLDTIASGLTINDDTTFSFAHSIIEKYNIKKLLPENVVKVINLGINGKIPETPKAGDKIFSKVENVLIGTNYVSLLASSDKARRLGYNTIIISSQVTGEAREVAKVFAGIADDIRRHNIPVRKPGCVIGGGETTVTIKGGGKGGRNQELALSFLDTIKSFTNMGKGIYFLSASTDGNDGPTDAAGAFASSELIEIAIKKNLKINDYLKNNDSYTFYNKIGGLLKTGPTNTNVCDLQIIIVQ